MTLLIDAVAELDRRGASGMITGVLDQIRAATDALNRGEPGPFAELIADECEWRGIPHGHPWWKRAPS